MKTEAKESIKKILVICFASFLMALNIKSFVRTGGLYPGGATGLALLIQRAADMFLHITIPYTIVNILLNAIPVYIGFRFIGKKFTMYKIQQKETEEQEEILPIKSLMPEIDCTIGIRNIGGNIEKYHEILQVYYREMSQMLEVLQDYANEDLEQFRISVHGIKGSSRNIGAEDLADEALQLEELAKEGKQAEILAKLEEFLNTLDEVMTRVDTYLKDASEQVERDGDFLPELELSSVYQILKALAEFDMDEAEECLKELYKNRYAEDVEEVLEELKRYIEDLDYKHATSLLEDYLKKIR